MQDERRLHLGLIGRAGSRAELNTPALVLDRDALDRNIAAMAAFAKERGVALRPHAKTHKSADIVRRQLDAGAIGICCAKLGEAEALADGVSSILLTSPVVTAPGIARLVHLARHIEELIVVVDHPDNVAALAAAASSHAPLSVLIDLDPGIRRTGVGSPEAALALFEAVRRSTHLRYRGLQYYCGLQQHIAAFSERKTAIEERTEYLLRTIDLLRGAGGEPEIVSGSGTGTHRIDADLGVFTEWQVGSYVFMDHQYGDCELGVAFEHALFVDAHVISANTVGLATTDAGVKAFAMDGGPPVIVSGAPAGATFHFMGDEHGAVLDADMKHAWKLGDSVRFVVPHCDPTVNLYDAYHVVSEDALVEIWPVTARGRSR